MQLPRIAAKFADVTASATLADGTPASIFGMDFAIVPPGASPTATTVWLSSTPGDGGFTILLAGPAVTPVPDGALVVPEPGGDLWARVVDVPETDAALVERISLA